MCVFYIHDCNGFYEFGPFVISKLYSSDLVTRKYGEEHYHYDCVLLLHFCCSFVLSDIISDTVSMRFINEQRGLPRTDTQRHRTINYTHIFIVTTYERVLLIYFSGPENAFVVFC